MAGGKSYQMMFQLSASLGGGFSSAFSSGSKSVTELQNKINALNKTNSDIAAYQKQQDAISKTEAKLQRLQTQYDRLSGVEAKTATEEAELQNKMEDKQATIDSTNEKLTQQKQKLEQMGAALQSAGVDTSNLASESERLKAEAQAAASAQEEEARAAEELGESLGDALSGTAAGLEAIGAVKALETVYNALKDCSEVAAQFETSMAGVKRTVGGDDAFIKNLGESFKELSTEIPITANELANIATTAGQLGIAQENVETFTTVMAKLATTTDLSADNAATMLAQFANITGTTDYERLGATVAALGDTTATTASKVVEMSQGMAAAANIAGMSETDILAISAAVGSLGIEAASGSTSMSTLISTLYKATQTGDKLEEFASVAGMTASEFKTSWENDAVGTLNSFVTGLNDVERNGKSAVVILDELGITNVRQTKAILGLASAGDLLTNTIDQANSAWEENTALNEKAGVMYGTTEAKLTMMQNAATNVQIAIGDALNPALGTLADALTNIMQPMSEWISAHPEMVTAITTFVGTLGTLVAGLTGYTAVTKLAAAASTLLGGALPLGKILLIAGAFAGLVGVISGISNALGGATESFEDLDAAYDNLVDRVKEQQEIIDLVDNYKQLSSEAKNLSQLMNGDFSTNVTFSASAPGNEGKLTPEDFVSDTTIKLNPVTAETLKGTDFLTDARVSLTADAASYLAGKDFLTTTRVELDAYQHELLTSESFLKDTKVKLTPQQKELLASEDFINGDRIIELTPKQATKLAAAGFMDGSIVYLTAKQANALMAHDFLQDGTEIQLTAEAAEKLKASEFMASPTVTITGEAGNTLTAKDFGISDQTLTYIATMDNASYEAIQQQAQQLKNDILSTDAQLISAQQKLTSAQEAAEALQSAIDGETNGKKKTALQERLDEVNKTITEQTEAVNELESKHEQLSSEFSIVGTAAQELQGKEEALIAVKNALAGASDLVTGSSEETAGAFDKEAEAAAKDAEAQLALLRSKMYTNIGKQTAMYAQAVNDAAEANENYQAVSRKTESLNKYASMSAAEVNSAYKDLLTTLDSMEEAEGWTPDNEDYKAAANEALTLATILGAYDESDIQDVAGLLTQGMGSWAETLGNVNAEGQEWNSIIADLGAQAVEYKSQIDSANKTQNEFINNLVNARLAGMEEEEVSSMLTNALEGEADAEATVAAIMKDVEAGVEAATAAKEEYNEATEEASENADEEASDIQNIVDRMNELKEAYNNTYKAALESMNGQFTLFQRNNTNYTNKGHDGGIQDMISALTEQNQYVSDYTENYQNAATALEQAGVSSETATALLSNLADGSAESSQYLKTIAESSDSELTTLAAQYETLQQTKSDYASTVADIQTNFSTTMATLTQELTDTVAKMDFSSEAASNAQKSMNSFVSALGGFEGQAKAKAEAIAQAVNTALSAIKSTITIDVVLGETPTIPKEAEGTDNAKRGVTLVGEEGPELVFMRGGETVLDANKTARVLQDSENALEAQPINALTSTGGSTQNYNVTFAPQYNVAAGVGADEVQSVLESQSENLREQFEGILADVMEDERRRSLA